MFPRLSITAALLCLVACATAPPRQLSETSAGDEKAAIESVVMQFFTALANKDIDGALATWSEKSPLRALLNDEFAVAVDYLARAPLSGITVTDYVVSDKKASLALEFTGKWRTADELFADEQVTLWTVQLRKENSRWKLWLKIYAAARWVIQLELNGGKQKEGYFRKGRRSKKRFVTRLLAVAYERAEEGQIKTAMMLIELAVEAAKSYQKDDLIATSLNNKGLLQWILLARAKDAAATLERALTHAQKLQDRSCEISIRTALATVLPDLRRTTDATRHAKKSVALAEKTGNAELLAVAQNMSGYVAMRTGNLDQAMSWFAKSLAQAKILENKHLQLQALVHVATCQWEQRIPGAAARSATAAATLALELGDRVILAKAMNTLGLVYTSSRRFRDAEKKFKACIEIWSEKGWNADRFLAMAWNNLGEVYSRQGRHKESRTAFDKSLEAGKRLPHPVRATTLAHNNLGCLLRHEHRYAEADEHYEKSYASALLRRSAMDMIWPVCNHAELFFIQGKYDNAIALFMRAAEIAKRVASPGGICVAQIGIGRSLFRRGRKGDLEKALEVFRKAIAHVERARESLHELMLRQGYLEERAHFYTYLINTLLRLGRKNEAFAASERARARSIVDVLRGGRVRVVKGMSEAEQREEQRLENATSMLTQQISTTYVTDRRDELLEQLQTARLKLEEFVRSLFSRQPELKTLRGQFDTVSLVKLNETLFARAPKLCVLSYVSVGGQLHLFALSRGKAQATLSLCSIAMPGVSLEERVDEFWRNCARAGAEYRKVGSKLFEILLGPVAEELRRCNQVVIVPDASLHRLPFHALIDPKTRKHLIQTHRVSYAPSVTALVEMTRLADTRRREPSKGLLPLFALGAPVMPARHGDLRGAEAEVHAIARLFRVKAVTGADATETRAKAGMTKSRRIHFATHGKVDAENPMYSHIVLGRDEQNDGYLQAREFAALNLQADLVVLSACETGSGKEVRGEGIVGLTWGLLVAGSASQIVSQWQVSDEGTKILMTSLYRHLAASDKKHGRHVTGPVNIDALRHAQLEALRSKDRAHPYYWAPFFLVGSAR